MYGYRLGLEGLWADETQPPSDAYEPLSRRADLFRQLHEENEAAADREVETMTQAVANIREAKDKMAAESHAAAAAIHYNNSLVGTVLSNIPLVGVANEDVEAKYKDRMRGHSQEYAGNNENLPPAHDYMTTITGHGYIDSGDGGDLYQQTKTTSSQNDSPYRQASETTGQGDSPYQQANTSTGQGDSPYQQADTSTGQGDSPYQQMPAYAEQGQAPKGSPSGGAPQGGGAPAGGAPQAGGTSAMSGGSGLVERPSAAAPPKIDAGGGGGSQGPAGGFQGGAGSQSPARVVPGSGAAGVGGGGSDASPRTATSGSAAGEKPAGAGSGSGSQGAGVRAGGLAGVGAAGGATSAQGGAPAGYRTAMHADSAAGAGAHALRVEHNTGLLATARVSGLTAPAFAALVSGTEALSASWAGLPSRLAARSPALSVVAAGVLVFGGVLRGSRWWGFGGVGGFDYAKLSLGVLERHGGISYLTLVFEERSVAPNVDAGVLCPVLTAVTSTEPGGAMRPGFEVPAPG